MHKTTDISTMRYISLSFWLKDENGKSIFNVDPSHNKEILKIITASLEKEGYEIPSCGITSSAKRLRTELEEAIKLEEIFGVDVPLVAEDGKISRADDPSVFIPQRCE